VKKILVRLGIILSITPVWACEPQTATPFNTGLWCRFRGAGWRVFSRHL